MTNDTRTGRAARLSTAEWIDAATAAILLRGISAVAVEPLAQHLGVTKGSFYWHFPNRDALLKAVLERWEEVATDAIIAMVAQIDDPRERLKQLILVALSYDPNLGSGAAADSVLDPAFELAISDAATDPIVEPILRRVSERRLDFLAQCYQAMGSTPKEARYQAHLAYAAYVGTLRLAREVPSCSPRDEAYREYLQQMIATIMPEDQRRSRENAHPPRPETSS